MGVELDRPEGLNSGSGDGVKDWKTYPVVRMQKYGLNLSLGIIAR